MHQFARVGHPVELAVTRPGHASGGSGQLDSLVHGVKLLAGLVGVEEVAVPVGDEETEDGFGLLEVRGDGRKWS